MPLPEANHYALVVRYPAVYLRGIAHTAKMHTAHNGADVQPTSGTYALVDRDGDAVIAETATSQVSDGSTYAIGATALDDYAYGPGYREIWKLVMPDGTTRIQTREVAIARYPFEVPISQDDLTRVNPELVSMFGTTATHLQDFIDEAWGDVLRRLWAAGRAAFRLVSSEQLHECCRELALYYCFRALGRRPDQAYLDQADHHWQRYEAAWASIAARWDMDDDGIADTDTRESVGTVWQINGNSRRKLGLKWA